MKLVTILTNQRSGSNLCDSILDKYGINWWGEWFCTEFGENICPHSRLKHPSLAIQKRIFAETKKGNRYGSLRLMESHFLDAVENWEALSEKLLSIVNSSDYVIVLYRKNCLAAFTSVELARVTGEWVSFEAKEKIKSENKKLHFDNDKFEEYIEVQLRWFKLCKRHIKNKRYKNIINFEDLVSKPSVSQKFDYIIPESWNLDLGEVKEKALPKKISKSNSLSEFYYNSEEVDRVLEMYDWEDIWSFMNEGDKTIDDNIT